MTTKQRTIRLRQMLQSHRDRVRGVIAETMRDVRDESHGLRQSEILDRADRVREEDIECSLLEMKTETLQRIDEALRRVDADAYGLCAECGQEISDQRLLAMPFAIRCRDCEELAEVTSPWQAPRRGPVHFDERYA